ncbi:hypothetical protein JTB14_029312 [Gonioctena quinquepunctata]|nr:hypothetical protein JTB14_029312 [Gonioctena quinquepunctata]
MAFFENCYYGHTPLTFIAIDKPHTRATSLALPTRRACENPRCTRENSFSAGKREPTNITHAEVQFFKSMTSEGQKCGLGSFLSMSCKGRAEAFARNLHSKLRSLGINDDNGSADESSWLAGNENRIAISQPRHSIDLDVELESPGSPELELGEAELQKLINKDTLRHSHSNDCQCPKSKEHQRNFTRLPSTNDSDSDCSFYDTENDVEQRLNGDSNSDTSKSQDDETGIDISSTQDETFATTSDCTPQPSSSSSGDASTLSLRDEDCPSLDINGSLTDVSKCEETDCNKRNGSIASEEIDFKIESNDSNVEIYVSHFTVDKDLTVECSNTNTVETTTELSMNGTFNGNETSTTDDDDESERIPRLRRCSSLKTGKTPPGTPGRKKIVRFADVLGLDLADVRTFLDEIPKIPVSAFVDLPGADLDDSSNSSSGSSKFHGIKVDRFLMPLFQQPGGLPNFLDLVRDNQVCLENAMVDDPVSLSISGTVRVRNLDFHKSVYVRYTLDSWRSFADVQGTYVNNSCDGFSDKFSFLLYAHTLSVGQRIEFALVVVHRLLPFLLEMIGVPVFTRPSL